MGRFDDDTVAFITETHQRADAFLFGRKTYEMFADTWGTLDWMRADPIGVALNEKPKYVASTTLTEARWRNSTLLSGDAAARADTCDPSQTTAQRCLLQLPSRCGDDSIGRLLQIGFSLPASQAEIWLGAEPAAEFYAARSAPIGCAPLPTLIDLNLGAVDGSRRVGCRGGCRPS